MKVEIVQLRMACDKLWAHLQELEIDSVDTLRDYYWAIPRQDVFHLESEPKSLVMGQLSDDWQSVQELFEPNADIIALDFGHLAAILQEVGEQVVI